MPIRAFLPTEGQSGRHFGPDEIDMMGAALEQALQTLQLIDRTDPLVAIVARKIIDLTSHGERNSSEIAKRAVAELRSPE